MASRRIVLSDWESVALTRGATVIVRPTSRQPRKRIDAFPPVRGSGRGAPFEIWSPDAEGDRISDRGRASVLWSWVPPADAGDHLALLETYRHVELEPDERHGGYTFRLEFRADMVREATTRREGIMYAHRGASTGRWLAARSMPSHYARHLRMLERVECCRLHDLTFTTIAAAMESGPMGPRAVEFENRWGERYSNRFLPWSSNPLVWVLRLAPDATRDS